MAYSYVSYRGGVAGVPSGTTGPFAFGSINFLETTTVSISDAIKVYVGGVLLTETTDYTLNLAGATKELTLVGGYSTGLLEGVYLKIQRSTKLDSRYVDYADSSNLTEQILDLDSNQEFLLIQENADSLDDCLRKGLDGNWDAEGLPIKNLSEGTDGTDAVNLNQLYSAIGGGTTAIVSGQTSITFTADGSTQVYTIPGRAGKDVDDHSIYRNGIKLLPTDAYTVADSGDDLVVTLVSLPVVGEKIEAVYGTGTAIGQLGPGAVSNVNLAPDAVEVDKIHGGNTPATNHYLKSNSNVVSWASLTADQITNFNTAANARRLSDFTLSPNATVNMGSQRISNLGTGIAGSSDAVRMSQLADLLNIDTGIYLGTNNPTSVPPIGRIFGISSNGGYVNGPGVPSDVSQFYLPGNSTHRYLFVYFSTRDWDGSAGEDSGWGKGGVQAGGTSVSSGAVYGWGHAHQGFGIGIRIA
jgi:hypothetical protein